MSKNTSESLTFGEAIQITQTLLNQVQSQEINPPEIESEIATLVKTVEGARGFFVIYLTDDNTGADAPTAEIIKALKTSPEVVSELLVKNLAMSTAMEITHRRNGDEQMAKDSQRVQQRTINLIKQLQLDTLTEQLNQLRLSLETANGDYQAFLDRWHYDTEQRQQIYQVIVGLG